MREESGVFLVIMPEKQLFLARLTGLKERMNAHVRRTA